MHAMLDAAGDSLRPVARTPPPPRPRLPRTRAALRPVLKRTLDVAGAALLLLVVAPTFAAVCLLLRLAGRGGPVFVARPRVGRGGREFGLLAFRVPELAEGGRRRPTRLGSALRWTRLDEVPQLVNVLRGDLGLVDPPPAAGEAGERRPTRLGSALRWTAIEEVPRLLNVLRGDLSLVGPRPVARGELERSYALFGGAAATAAYLSVRPGLVGPCQVRGRGGVDLGWGERVALDVAYAQRPSLRADLAILARALGLVLRAPVAG